MRIDARGQVAARASSHRGYQHCKQARCTNRWGAATGWTRVSRGSHAGHLPLRSQRVGSPPATEGWGGRRAYRDEPQYPGVDLRERTTTSAGVRLVPLERVDPRTYRPLNPGITPPWRKRVFRDPLSDSTS